MTVEDEYKQLTTEQKQKVKMIVLGQISLIILGSLITLLMTIGFKGSESQRIYLLPISVCGIMAVLIYKISLKYLFGGAGK